MLSIKYKIFLSCLLFMAIDINAKSNLESLITTSSGNTVLTVGTDIDCDYDNIQAAIDVSDPTENTVIYVTNQKQWIEQLHIINKSNLRIFGSHTTCTQPSNTDATIKGSAAASASPIVTIEDSSQIFLFHLNLTGASYSGGMTIDNSEVTIQTSRINNNHHRSLFGNLIGGGIYVTNNASLYLYSVNISGNNSSNGGGIACLNSQVIMDNSTVFNNHAQNNNHTAKGGGIYASSNCNFSINNYMGYSFNNSNDISFNSADYQGGGLYVGGGAQVQLNHPDYSEFQRFTAESTQVRYNLIANQADSVQSGGAGIAMSGQNSQMNAYHLTLADNRILDNVQQVGNGGALLLNNGASFNLDKWKADNNCSSKVIFDTRHNRMCNQIIDHNNSGNKGGMAYLDGASVAEIHHTYISENLASDGHLAYISGATLRMQGSIITQNGNTFFGGGELIYAQSGGNFIGDFNTFTNNRLGSGLGDGFVIATAQAGNIHLTRSIIDEAPETDLFLNSIVTTSSFNCLLTHEGDSFFGTDITIGIPHFQVTWPYHLHGLSDGVDMCQSTGGSMPIEKDIDGDIRGFCRGPSCASNPQRFDAGADEYQSDDVIFTDGFD